MSLGSPRRGLADALAASPEVSEDVRRLKLLPDEHPLVVEARRWGARRVGPLIRRGLLVAWRCGLGPRRSPAQRKRCPCVFWDILVTCRTRGLARPCGASSASCPSTSSPSTAAGARSTLTPTASACRLRWSSGTTGARSPRACASCTSTRSRSTARCHCTGASRARAAAAGGGGLAHIIGQCGRRTSTRARARARRRSTCATSQR